VNLDDEQQEEEDEDEEEKKKRIEIKKLEDSLQFDSENDKAV